MKVCEIVDIENMSTINLTNIGENVTIACTEIESEDVFMEDIINLFIILFVFILSISVNITILLAFFRKQSLRTISNRWAIFFIIFAMFAQG